jgi:hypothetical protein
VKIRRLGALVGAAALVLSVAGVAFADSPAVATVGTPAINGLSVTISGTWTWDACTANNTKKFAGVAVSWGDSTSGNTIQGATKTYDMGTDAVAVGTACTATPGNYSASHTYAAAGTFMICPVVYDVEADTASGDHSTVAGGSAPAHNTDNSVEGPKGGAIDATCVSVDVAPASSTEAAPSGSSNGTLPLILLLVGVLAAAVVIRPLARRGR